MLPTLSFKIEKWKFYEPANIYVSTLGRFKDTQGQLLKPKINQGGYLRIRHELAHRIVMKTWRPCENMDKLTVDHLNHNKRDNSLDNLEWVTKEENNRRATEDLIIDNKEEAVVVYYVNGVKFSKQQIITAFSEDVIEKLRKNPKKTYYGKIMEARYEYI